MVDLGPVGAESHAYGVNDDDLVVGMAVNSQGLERAVAWDPFGKMLDLGTLGGPTATANGLNNAGAIVGWAYTPNAGEIYHAAKWTGPQTFVRLTTPAEGGSYGQGEQVNADYSCAGAVSCVGDVSSGDPIDTALPGPHTFTLTANDGSGHTKVVTHHYTVRPDTTSPAITVSVPGDNAGFMVGQHVAAAYSCTDAAVSSGLTSCAGDVPSGALLDTASVGPHSFTVSAVDGAGNSSTVVHTYQVVPPLVSIGDARVVEGDTGKPRSVRFPVTLSGPSSQPVTVQWSVDTVGSTQAGDVRLKSGLLTFKPAAKSGLTPTLRYVTVAVYPDQEVDPDETYEVTLSNPTGGYALGRSVGAGTIEDDDPGTGLTVGIGDTTLIEGSVGTTNAASLTVSLSAPATSSVSVQVVVLDGSATVAAGDYKAAKVITLTFAPGQWQKSIAVKVFPDRTAESDETIAVMLSSPSAALSIGRPLGTITILDDD